MKLLRTLISALATVIVAGTVASAAPGFRAAFDLEPVETPVDEVTLPSEEPSDSSEEAPDLSDPSEEVSDPSEETPELSETPEPTDPETSSPEDPDGEDGSAAPDFSACVGLTGLENAICRHQALLVLQPDNPGLANALQHLLANLAKHAGETEEPPSGDTGEEPPSGDTGEETEGTTDGQDALETAASTAAPCPGKSCEPHGKGGHGAGSANGHGKANGRVKH